MPENAVAWSKQRNMPSVAPRAVMLKRSSRSVAPSEGMGNSELFASVVGRPAAASA